MHAFMVMDTHLVALLQLVRRDHGQEVNAAFKLMRRLIAGMGPKIKCSIDYRLNKAPLSTLSSILAIKSLKIIYKNP